MNLRHILFSLLLVLAAHHTPLAQNAFEEEEEELVEVNYQKANLKTIAQALAQSEEEEVIFSELEIRPSQTDQSFLVDKIFYQVYRLNSPMKTPKSIHFYNCRFIFDHTHPLEFTNWQVKKLNFIDCEFSGDITFDKLQKTGRAAIRLVNIRCAENLSFSGDDGYLGKVNIENSTFHKSLIFESPGELLAIDNCQFFADSSRYISEDEEAALFQLQLPHESFDEFSLTNSKFSKPLISNLYSANLQGASIDKLEISHCQLQSINFTDASIGKACLINQLDVAQYIGVQNFDLPAENTNIPWENINREKLCLFTPNRAGALQTYQATDSTAMADIIHFNELISCYKKLNAIYHTRGDLGSANGSYVEIKDLETRRLAHLQKYHSTTNTYINLQINRFLKYFCNYATNPARSLVVALWVILAFSFLYMLSFSEWDGINARRLLNRYRLITTYFITDKSLESLYSETLGDTYEDIENFKTEYLNNSNDAPYFVRILGRPIYYLYICRFEFIKWLLKRLEILNGNWIELNLKRRILIGTVMFTFFLFYSVYLVAIKFINGFVLSLNMFITIGFGKMPEKGAPMYLAVIEGFVGWIMLSFFSITIISQVLMTAG